MRTILEKHYLHNFEKLVKNYKYRCGSEQAAEDVVQEAYTRALKYIDTFEMGMHFNHWFVRILVNSFNHYKNMERGHSECEDLENVDAESQDVTPMLLLSIEEIKTLIGKRENHYEEILRLYFIYGYSLKDIVKITSCNKRTVETYVQRFKSQLKEIYAGLYR